MQIDGSTCTLHTRVQNETMRVYSGLADLCEGLCSFAAERVVAEVQVLKESQLDDGGD